MPKPTQGCSAREEEEEEEEEEKSGQLYAAATLPR
jgi:hypothetical protein